MTDGFSLFLTYKMRPTVPLLRLFLFTSVSAHVRMKQSVPYTYEEEAGASYLRRCQRRRIRDIPTPENRFGKLQIKKQDWIPDENELETSLRKCTVATSCSFLFRLLQ